MDSCSSKRRWWTRDFGSGLRVEGFLKSWLVMMPCGVGVDDEQDGGGAGDDDNDDKYDGDR